MPNLTEAALMLGVPYQADGYDEAYVLLLAKYLAALGPEHVVITDVALSPDQTGVATYDRLSGAFHIQSRQKFPGFFTAQAMCMPAFCFPGYWAVSR